MQRTSNEAQAAQQPLRVLVVDDEKFVRTALERLLAPFEVTFAQSAAGALGRLQVSRDFDAILCDINMPGMNGMQFYEEVSKVSRPLAGRIIFITGGVFSPEIADFLERTHNACLAKPFERETLKTAVKAAAHGPKAP